MIKKILLLVPFISLSVCSQSFYMKMGKNFTKYDYVRNNQNVSERFLIEVGNSYELGYFTPINTNKKFGYEVGILLNDYNGSADVVKIPSRQYDFVKYRTQYLGLENALLYSIVKTKKITTNVRVGVDGNKIIFGTHEIYGRNNELIQSIEKDPGFKGFLWLGSLGLEVKYAVSKYATLSLGYNKRYTILNTGNESNQTLTLKNDQIKLGIYFRIRDFRDYEE